MFLTNKLKAKKAEYQFNKIHRFMDNLFNTIYTSIK